MKKTVLLLLTLGLTQAILCQQSIPQKLDELLQAYCKVNKFNGSVLIARKGTVLLEKGYGIKNDKTHALNDRDGIFQIYSITKTFTSTVILKLVELKKLSLSDKLYKLYPQIPKADSITIEHLLTHTSGIYDYTRGNDMADQTEPSFIKFIASKPLDFSPGTAWSYSNSGYWLLGFIIEKTTGMTYEEAVKKYILQPLQMNHTWFDFKNLEDKNKTTGYAIFADKMKKEAVIYDPPGAFSSGAICATVGDLYKYHKGLQTFKIISEASLRNAYTPFKNNYGYGWIIGSFEGKQMVSHSGGAAGYRSNFVRIPEDDICISLLNNHENANVELITKNLLHILYDKPYKLPMEIKLPVAVLEQFTGVFPVVKPPLTMYVTIEDGRLVAQASGQPKTVLWAEKENYFFSEEAGGFLEFIKDEKGKYNELIIRQQEQTINGKRINASWGLTGTATSKGWEESIPDIPFTEDSLSKAVWVLKNIPLKTGLIVFRLNNDWGYHYGDNGNDKVLDMYGADIKTEDGLYDITLDLRNTLLPVYTMVRKN